jgi:thymidylate synthase ThyX
MNNFYGDEHKDFFLSRAIDYYELIDILGSKELARYVLPMATTAHMYHTINLLTAFRYLSICYSIKTKEAIEFAKLIENEINQELVEVLKIVKSTKAILPDYKLEFNGVTVKAIAPMNYDITNSLDVLKTSNILTSSLATGSLRSRLRVSLACDSQLQRHRRAITIRSKLDLIDGYYIPKAILENKQALDIYKKANDEAIELILKTGNEYLFLNSQYVILEQQEDLESFFHKAQLRLCLNSQDEIRDVVKSQIEGLKAEGIDTSIFKEPCVVRYKNNIKPICPEGERFCGVKVWLKETER